MSTDRHGVGLNQSQQTAFAVDAREYSPPRADVALLVDWENLKWSLDRRFRIAPNISSLVQAAEDFGRLVVARAYADWTAPVLRLDAPNLYRAGIEPVYVPSKHPTRGSTLKNSADVKLAVDAAEISARFPHIGVYLLVTGDGDLIHILNYLRLNGRRVVVIGVGESMNALISSSADDVLLYEEDIERLVPRDAERADSARAADTATMPTDADTATMPIDMEKGFALVVSLLRERGNNRPYPFNRLGHDLKRRHGLDAQVWYRMPFKRFLQKAEDAGLIHLSTQGGMDYAALPGAVDPDADIEPRGLDEAAGALPETEREATADADSGVVLEALSREEQLSLVAYLHELQHNSHYLTRTYIVNKLIADSVLPRLTRDQIGGLLDNLKARGVLIGSDAEGYNRQSARTFTFVKLQLDDTHDVVKDALSPTPLKTVDPALRDAAFEQLDAVLEGLESAHGVPFFSTVMEALEERLDVQLDDLGYDDASAFMQAAQQRGLVRIERQRGFPVVLRADKPLASPDDP